MASKKGVALTGGIAAAIVGSSFLIWYIPQSSPGGSLAPRADNEVFADVYARHNNLAPIIELKFDDWKNNNLPSENMTVQLDSAKSQIEQMREELTNRQPSQEWKTSYNVYVQALEAYTAYLDALKTKVDNGDKSNADPVLNQEWQDLVKQSLNAIPI